jgi:hypothetical protein
MTNLGRQGLALVLMLHLSGCSGNESIQTAFISSVCIKPLINYHYHTCNEITFIINGDVFTIPAHFETDLASIPRIAWPFMAPAHSALIRAAIVHDWFYRKTCHFSRDEADLIFYHMMKNDGVSKMRASTMYYAVRGFGWNYYNEDSCDERFKRMDQKMRRIRLASLLRYSG